MSDAFTDYLRDKRVVLVGPAGYMMGLGQGALIDSYDVVVRLNLDCPVRPDVFRALYPDKTPSVPEDIGTRTDVLYHTLFNASLAEGAGQQHTPEQIAAWRADGVQFLVTRGHQHAQRVRDLSVVMERSGVSIPTVHPTRTWYRRLADRLGTPPNMGTVAIRHLLDQPLRSLHVTGMSFRQPWEGYRVGYGGFDAEQASHGDGSGHWGQPEHWRGLIPHDQRSQMDWLVDLYHSDTRLSLDAEAARNIGIVAEPSVVAIVPMKGVSERLPGKNTRIVAGKPLLYWALDALQRAGRVSRVVVTTDSPDIAAQVREHFGRVDVVMQPPELSTLTMNGVLAGMLPHVEGEHFLQAHVTSPLLLPATVDAAVEAYFAGLAEGADSLYGVTRHQTWFLRADGTPVGEDPADVRRTQDLEPLFEVNSAVHLFSRASFERTGSRMGTSPRMFEVPKVEAVDVDYEDDIRIAEALLLTRDGEAARTVRPGEAARTVRPGGKYQMGAVVYRTSKQADGSYLIVGKVGGQPRRVVATFAVPDGVAPTIAMAQQALREGGAPADESAATEPAGEAQGAPTGAGEPGAEGDAQAPGNEGGGASDAVTELLSQPVAQLAGLVASVEDVALLDAALAAEEAGKGRKTALEAIQARIEALTAAVGA